MRPPRDVRAIAVWFLIVGAVVLLQALTQGCAHAPPAVQEVTIRAAPDRPYCDLPPVPEPAQIVGWPEDRELLVTKSDARDLLRAQNALSLWARAATLCLQEPQ